jgi:hypothetical protein
LRFLILYVRLGHGPKPESRFDKKPSKNAEISLNLTTQITNLFSRPELFGGILHRMG